MKNITAIISTIFLSINLLAVPANTEASDFVAMSDTAIEKGLEYISGVQLKNGNSPGTYGNSTGIVSLAGMAFLSKGYTPYYGKNSQRINQCIEYVLSNARPDGLIASPGSRNEFMYSHNISTLFLSEVSGMVSADLQNKIDAVLPKAVKLIITAQQVVKSKKDQRGWRYKPNSTDSDLSCSGWALMALRSSKHNGAPVPNNSIKSAVDYIFRNFDSKTGTFGYTDTRSHSKSLTGSGLLCLELTGYHGHPSTISAADYISSIYKLPMNWQFYGNYYNSQAMFQMGGKYWADFAAWYYPQYLKLQRPNGSWIGSTVSDVYSTALTILALTVPHRQLPIYQRDEVSK